MRYRSLLCASLVVFASTSVVAQQTPKTLVTSYDSIADTILAVRRMEADFVRALLDGHRHAAEAQMKRGDFLAAAAEMALFANEGDNAVGGVRKRLVEGGHHHNAAGEEKGLFDSGFVIVTREARKTILELSAKLRSATDAAGRDAVWKEFSQQAAKLLGEG